MKYCTNCGEALDDAARFCSRCGSPTEQYSKTYVPPSAPAARTDVLDTLSKVFMIIGCVITSLWLIPLCWCVPMTVSLVNKLNRRQTITTGFKVCTLLFVSLVAGILLLCRDESRYGASGGR